MGVLFLTTKFPLDPASPYLTNDLCAALVAEGTPVTVINIDWHGDNAGESVCARGGVTVFNTSPCRYHFLPGLLNKGVSWAFSSLHAYRFARKALRGRRFDTVIISTPLTIFSFFLFVSTFAKGGQRVALCWDFFPFHQVKLGLLPKILSPVLRRCEEIIYSSCTRICVLSDDYRGFLRANYRIPERVEVVNSGLWGGELAAAAPLPAVPLDGSSIVFGGQIIAGRSTSNFLQLCRSAAKVDPAIRIVILGRGAMLGDVLEAARREGLTNLFQMDPLTRSQYIQAIGGCLAGLVSLDGDTGCPSFPSKMVDYARAGLPVIVVDSINAGLQSLVESREIGFYVRVGDFEKLEEALRLLVERPQLRALMAGNSRRLFEEDFNPRRVASVVLTGKASDRPDR